MEKKTLTPEQIYEKNKKLSKTLQALTPIAFWGLLALSLLCLILALKNSFGNVAEISALLDGKVYNKEQVSEHYAMLVEKYGEWNMGMAGGGFEIKFVNISNALFSGIAITNAILCVVFLVCAFLLGKWILPRLSKQIADENQDMVNINILRNNKE